MTVATPGRLGVGLVGSGFMGRAHAFAFGAVVQVFDLPLRPELVVLADRSDEIATQAARQLGFAKAVSDWRLLINDPAVDVVAITAPNAMHKPIALAALATVSRAPASIDTRLARDPATTTAPSTAPPKLQSSSRF